jgi:hypothetical protein
MSIDRYFKQTNGNWVRIDARTVDGENEYIPQQELQDLTTEFWVDISHGANLPIDERYYFSDLASAIDFYSEGWKERQYLDEDGKEMGLDHSGLYSRGRLIHGQSIHGDAPGHEGENLRRVCEALTRQLDAEEEGC